MRRRGITQDQQPRVCCVAWDSAALSGPDGADWRVPVTELEMRQNKLRSALSSANIESAWVSDPVDLYWLCGNRQAGAAWIPSTDLSASDSVQFVRSSLQRARHESGADDAPHELVPMPRMATLTAELLRRGATRSPALQRQRLPASDADFLKSKMDFNTPSTSSEDSQGGSNGRERMEDCTQIIWGLREIKSEWELNRMRESGGVQRKMFEAVAEYGLQCAASGKTFTELELAAAAESVSRAAGFAGHIRMRKWPMDCDRAVVASGPSGALPSFFDSAVGAAGPHPLAALGAGHRKIQRGEPVIVDIVHVHRGYVSDMTRMFSLGSVHDNWHERQADMVEVAKIVRTSLGRGRDCSAAWSAGVDAASQMGHADYLMGMAPDQAKFLGHSIGLELDETPVVAAGFDRPLPIGATMAIEPKVIQIEGAVGIEDSWVRTATGMERLSGTTDAGMATNGVDGGEPFPDWTEW